MSGLATPLTRNRLKRGAGFFVGIVLFYAPFALLAKGVGLLFPASLAGTAITDVHTACLRMPYGWLTMPWMWPTLSANPISWLPILVLPIAATAFGPLFCGWLCPAGALPEHLGRIVPDKFKFDFKGSVEIVPLRYGFFAGFLLAPFVSTSICCSFCNFTHMQNIVSGVFGDLSGWVYFSTLGVVALTLWIVPLGLFTKGGRGWCLFLCPAGTVMGLVSHLTRRSPWARRVRVDASVYGACGLCEDVCPTRAIDVTEGGPAINHHLCNECMDCVRSCSSKAYTYGRPS